MGTGVAVTADDGPSRLRNSKFRTDYVNNPVPGMIEPTQLNSMFFAIFGQHVNLVSREIFLDGQVLVNGRNVVVGCGNRVLGPENFQSTTLQSEESHRTGHFMYQVPVNIQYIGTTFNLCDDVAVPYFIKKRFC
jgi:hypothetical protein